MKLTPAASILTTASPAFGSGRGTSSYRSTSGPPGDWARTAFMTRVRRCRALIRSRLLKLRARLYSDSSRLTREFQLRLSLMRRRAIGLLAAAHLFDDLNQGVVPALLPFFIAERRYTIAAAGGLVLAATLTSSVLQPLFGLLADRRGAPWLVPSGLLRRRRGGRRWPGLLRRYPLAFLCGGRERAGSRGVPPRSGAAGLRCFGRKARDRDEPLRRRR